MKKMKKLLSIILVAFLAITISACSGSTGDDESSESGNSSSPDNLIKIEDIEWSVEEEIIDGERNAIFNFTNNSNYTISEYRLTFVQKEGVTDEQIDSFYATLKEDHYLDDDDITEIRDNQDKISMYTIQYIPISSGESFKDVLCYFSGASIMFDMDSYELVEPDIFTFYYVYNNTIYCEYYDYQSNSYSMESYTTVANEFIDCTNELKDLLPSLDEFDVIELDKDEEGKLKITVKGVDTDESSNYLSSVKETGFTVNVDEDIRQERDRYTYTAENDDGYIIDLNYRGDGSYGSQYNDLEIILTSPDYEEE